jgi:predicted nicotinamide N-methyase
MSAEAAPFFADTPRDAVRQTWRERVVVDGRTFLIDRPEGSDKLLDHPAIQRANQIDDYVPYWPEVWPASRMLAKAILREPWDKHPLKTTEPLEALELGCGLGLAGLSALARGLRVTFSDYDRTALEFAAANARLNGFRDFRCIPLDWRHPPPDLKVPIVLGADLLYEARNIDPILALIREVLLPGGVCLLTDPDRTPHTQFRRRLAEVGFSFTMRVMRAGEPGGPRVKGTLYRIRVG